MNTTIWKYTIDPKTTVTPMKAGAIILYAREQGNDVCVWAIVNPETEDEPRRIKVYGTGWGIDTVSVSRRYLGSAHLEGGALIFHVFEETT